MQDAVAYLGLYQPQKIVIRLHLDREFLPGSNFNLENAAHVHASKVVEIACFCDEIAGTLYLLVE